MTGQRNGRSHASLFALFRPFPRPSLAHFLSKLSMRSSILWACFAVLSTCPRCASLCASRRFSCNSLYVLLCALLYSLCMPFSSLVSRHSSLTAPLYALFYVLFSARFSMRSSPRLLRCPLTLRCALRPVSSENAPSSMQLNTAHPTALSTSFSRVFPSRFPKAPFSPPSFSFLLSFKEKKRPFLAPRGSPRFIHPISPVLFPADAASQRASAGANDAPLTPLRAPRKTAERKRIHDAKTVKTYFFFSRDFAV